MCNIGIVLGDAGVKLPTAILFMNSNKSERNIRKKVAKAREKCMSQGIVLGHDVVINKGPDRDIDRDAVNMLITFLLDGEYQMIVVDKLTDLTSDLSDFTRIGKRTVNAKAIANKSVAARLFVYGIEKNDVLIPTCGFGDYLYYAMWISGIHSLSESIQAYIFGAFMIFVGIIIQCVVIKKLSIRDNFKGFPGTVFPFLGTVLAYLAVQMVV